LKKGQQFYHADIENQGKAVTQLLVVTVFWVFKNIFILFFFSLIFAENMPRFL